MKQPLALNDDFRAVLDQLERTRDNLFITGRAGTGKSTLLQLFRNTTKKRVVVLAPTGIAALNVKGQTIHSFFGLPPKLVDPRELGKRRNHSLYKRTEVIIIDEISMVRADLLDNIDIFLRNNREVNKPFGGIQMVFFGDLFQLPPVVASDFERKLFVTKYNSPYFFSAKVIEDGSFTFQMIELYQVFRQGERKFINLLDNIRLRTIDMDDMMEINERHTELPSDRSYYITLTSINAIANQINQLELNQIDTPIYNYAAKIMGDFRSSVYPTAAILSLKEGAQVMFVKNDPQKRYVNGSIGIIEKLTHESIYVRFRDNIGKQTVIELERLEWEILKYAQDEKDPKKIKTKIVGTFEQYPIKLAWAITIHKSQGKTFDNIIVDLGRGAFEYGQTYVALSRCRTLDGIILKRPLRPKDILVDERVREYYETLRHFS